MIEITAKDLFTRLKDGENLYLLDVREQNEFAAGAIVSWPVDHVPLGTLPQRAEHIPLDRPIVCICRSGGRSARAAQWLESQGAATVYNLTGGMKAWSADIDPAVEVI